MPDFRNVSIDVEGLEEGKFYKLYVDKNALAVLKVDKREDDQLASSVAQNTENLQKLEDKNPVNITINNNQDSGSCPSNEKVSDPIDITGASDIKLSELSVHAIVVDYCAYSGKNIECGRLTIIDGLNVTLDAERASVGNLLPLEFSANRNNDVLNLHIVVQDGNVYQFKYKTIVF